jgi:hypothetical protein
MSNDCFFVFSFSDMIMSKSTCSELKFSIRNLIDTNSVTYENKEKSLLTVSNSSYASPNKKTALESDCKSIARPIPLFKPPMPTNKSAHPCWSFLSQFANKNAHNISQMNSPLVLLSKMNQVWEHYQRSQISPLIATATSSTTEHDDMSDDDIDMDTSLRRSTELDDEDDDEDEVGECSSSGGDKQQSIINLTPNSDDNDKSKTYPCTQCGKVKR